MRGAPDRQPAIYHTFNVEDLIEPGHPLRPIKRMVDRALEDMGPALGAAYSGVGRPGVPPETLLKALLLQCLYTIRSERELCRRLKTDLLFRWFLDLQPSDEVFDHSVFTHNRDRLAEHGLTRVFFEQVVRQAIDAGLTSDEHFTVDGSLIQSHASLKSLRKVEREVSKKDDGPPDGGVGGGGGGGGGGRNPSVDFKGEQRTNTTHASTTDPQARLYKKGDGVGAFLCHSGHALTENRHGLVMRVRVEEANGRAERESTLAMLDELEDRHGVRPSTLGADKGYDAGPFILELEKRWIDPHVAIRSGRIDPLRGGGGEEGVWARWFVRQGRRRAGYRKSQRRRKLVEEFFGWVKTVAGLRRARHVGREKIRQCFELAAAAYNLVRMRTLLAS